MNARTIAVARESLVHHLRTAVLMAVVLTVLLGIIYPLIMTGIAQVIFPNQANGSLVRDASGNVVGSAILAQSFAQPQYFHPRPSAAGTKGYDASSSGGSNLGPNDAGLLKRIGDVTKQLADQNPGVAIPVDLVTTSGSGLDPHISPEGAKLQVARVAKARGLSEDAVLDLVRDQTEGRQLGVLGEPRVNVLLLNLALDRETGKKS